MMTRHSEVVRVRVWDPGIPGAILTIGPAGLLWADRPDFRRSLEANIVDPAVPTSLMGWRAKLAHRRLAALVHDCFGPCSGISRSPAVFRRSLENEYGILFQNRRLLDIGCGEPSQLTGWLTKAAEVTGIDLFPSNCVPPGVSYLHIPLSGLFPVEPGVFDFALGLFVLEHVIDLDQTLSETYRALRPGGTAVWITTLSPNEISADTQPLLTLGHWRDFTYLQQQDAPWLVPLETLICKAGSVGFEASLVLGTRFREGEELRWTKLAASESRDCDQVLIEMRKVS